MTEVELYKKLKSLPSQVRKIVRQTVNDNKKEIISRNQGQLAEGLDSNDKKLGKYKSKPYIKKRELKGKQIEFVDLNFTGKWQGGFYAKFDKNGISIGSKKKKMWGDEDVLVHHWGEDIFGLNEKNFDWLLDVITDSLYTELTIYFK